jgi:hypothetical protein
MTAIITLWQTHEVLRDQVRSFLRYSNFSQENCEKPDKGAKNQFLAIFSKSKHFRVTPADFVDFSCRQEFKNQKQT